MRLYGAIQCIRTSTAILVMFGFLTALSVTIGNSIGQTAQEVENPLLTQIRKEFQRKNSRISEVSLVEIAPFRRLGPAEKYVLVAWGITGRDAAFKGDFWDEVFGFFVADGKLTTIEETLGIVPTPRWRDYAFTIDRVTDDLVTVRGAGDTYGDGPKVLRFKWNPFTVKPAKRIR